MRIKARKGAEGVILVDGCNVMRTGDEKWSVSQDGTWIGQVELLSEIEPLITRHRDAVRARVTRLESEAAQRRENTYTDESMRRGEAGYDPNHHNPTVGFLPDGTPYDM